MEEPKNFLGIDWGERKIGLALAHAETRLAMAYGVWQNDQKFLSRLEALITDENIGTVVIGVPKHKKLSLDISSGEKFGAQLQAQVDVVYEDEMFTTTLAQAILRERGETVLHTKDDAEAAGIILQAWLDREKRVS